MKKKTMIAIVIAFALFSSFILFTNADCLKFATVKNKKAINATNIKDSYKALENSRKITCKNGKFIITYKKPVNKKCNTVTTTTKPAIKTTAPVIITTTAKTMPVTTQSRL